MRGTPDDGTDDRDHAGDERYPYVDLRDDPDDPADDEGDEDGGRAPAVRRRRPATRKTATRRTTAGKTTARKSAPKRRGRSRHGAELAGGALVVMTLIGYGAYAVAANVLGLPRDAALVLAGLAAGLTPGAGRAILAGRRRAASWIAPKGART